MLLLQLDPNVSAHVYSKNTSHADKCTRPYKVGAVVGGFIDSIASAAGKLASVCMY